MTIFAAIIAGSPPLLLGVFILGSAALSVLLNHDVVVVAMTPVLAQVALSRGLNPVPFLLGFCFASNIAAAASQYPLTLTTHSILTKHQSSGSIAPT